MAVPSDIEVRFATAAEAAARLPLWQAEPKRTLLLTGDIDTMAALHTADGGIVKSINLGGIHHRPGRRQRLPYVYLTDDEFSRLKRVEAEGAQVSAQDVPTAVKVPLRNLL
jgi:mannose/fructose/N-acetylgalactosamine-specific phosphotransferase system component IIB